MKNGNKLNPDYLIRIFEKDKPGVFHFADVVDFILEKRIKRCAKNLNIKVEKYTSPMFLSEENLIGNFFSDRKKFLMASFYSEQRKRLNILMDGQKPVGGKWSYDAENRKTLSENLILPGMELFGENKYVQDAKVYLKKHYKSNPGSTENFFFPTNHKDAEAWLNDFLQNRFRLFGDYEDAIAKDELIIYHSVLSPLLNSGLLIPEYVVEKSTEYALENKIPINSHEGFIRQIIGWREFIRGVYEIKGSFQRNSNYFGFNKKMPGALYEARSGIEPVDSTIKKLHKSIC